MAWHSKGDLGTSVNLPPKGESMYNETTEQFETMFDLQQETNRIIQAFREAGKILDVEISIDLLEMSVTVITPKEADEN